MHELGTESGFCSQTAGLWQFAGLFILIIKILVPVALILIGIITLGKAVISTDEGDTKKGFKLLLKKFIVSVFIFFLPGLISVLFSAIDTFKDVRSDYMVCNSCITDPKGDYCVKKVVALESLDA